MMAQALQELPRSQRRAAARLARASRADQEFLPAALEILEQPPSPVAWWLTLLLCGFCAIAIAWAWIGTVDVVAIAEGRIVPSGRIKVIQPLEAGVVRAINVVDGMTVRAGDVLVELDPTSAESEREHLARDLAGAEVSAARLRALLAAESLADLERRFTPAPDAPADVVATQRRLMLGERAELDAHLAVMRDDIRRRQAERAGVAAAIAGYERSIPILRERTEMRAQLAQTGAGSRLNLLTEQQQLVGEERELAVQRQHLGELAAGIAQAESQVRQTEAEFRRSHLSDLNEAEQKAAVTRQDLLRAVQRHRLQTLTAPISGTVQQLAIHTIGGVVTPAQQLMVIVPEGDTLEIEATLQNRDIGFVRAGQEAEIKLETFLYTRYGTVPGRVVSVSSDAISNPGDPQLQQQPGAPAHAQQGDQAPLYVVRVRLDRATMDIDGATLPLGAGMRATVEVKTERRRVIEYLLSPLMRARHESLRER
jgi:hemolysin D